MRKLQRGSSPLSGTTICRWHNIALHCVFGLIAGCIYLLIELAWRGHTHWTMLPLAAAIFVCIGVLDEGEKPPPVWQQVVIGTAIATALEFVAGLILNIWLDLGVWDYSHLPGNVMGQICPQFTLAWAVLVIVSIRLENIMHRIADRLTK